MSLGSSRCNQQTTVSYHSSRATCTPHSQRYDTLPIPIPIPIPIRGESPQTRIHMTIVSGHAPNRPIWFDVMTSDPDGARKFYAALFGWNYDIGGEETGFYTMCKVGGANAAGLGPIMPGQNMPPAWTVYFGVSDIEATATRVVQAGGQIAVPIMQIMHYGRMAVCVDSTGAAFGLWQPQEHVGAMVIEQHGAMGWCEVNTRNAEDAAAFYRDVFDLAPQQLDDSSMTYYMLNQNGTAVAGVLQMGPDFGNAPPHWIPYFVVNNMDESTNVVTSNGGTVTHGPFPSPYGRIAVIMDPQGAMLCIIQPPAAA